MPKPPLLFYLSLSLLPIFIALFPIPWYGALALVFFIFFMRWLGVLRKVKPTRTSRPLILESISASHFVEKVRWCLDRLEIPYQEQGQAGILGVFFRGRTVPRLHIPTGLVYSQIGNSSDILRYLWGRYGQEKGAQANFLKPSLEALELESKLDEYGVQLQVWFYSHALNHAKFSLKVWGFWDRHVSTTQKVLVFLFRPLLGFLLRKAFRIKPSTQAKVKHKIEDLLSELETCLGDGRQTLLNQAELSFVDISFASLSGIWAYPEGYTNGRAADVLPPASMIPKGLEADIQHWKQQFPACYAFICDLYQHHRIASHPQQN